MAGLVGLCRAVMYCYEATLGVFLILASNPEAMWKGLFHAFG